jgi:hypothetical protein
MLRKFIKEHFIQHNIDCIGSQIIPASMFDITVLSPSERLALETRGDFSIKDSWFEHRENLKPVLEEIRNHNILLLDRPGMTSLFKPSLESLISLSPTERYKVYLQVDRHLQELETLLTENQESGRLAHAEALDKKGFSTLESFVRVISKLYQNESDILALRTYLHYKDGAEVSSLIKSSKQYLLNIEAHPDFAVLVDRLVIMLEPLNTADLLTLNSFCTLHSSLSMVMLQPYMVSVLGNVLFFKVLLPLCGKYSHLSPLRSVTNWGTVWTKVYKKSLVKNVASRITSTLYDYRRPILSFVTGSPLASYLWFLRTPSVIEQTPLSTRTARGLVDGIPQPRGYMGVPGTIVGTLGQFLGSTGVEIGRMTGKFTKGVVWGFLDENRPLAEATADKYDESQRNNERLPLPGAKIVKTKS